MIISDDKRDINMGNYIFDFLIGLKRDNSGEKGKKEKIEIVGEKGK